MMDPQVAKPELQPRVDTGYIFAPRLGKCHLFTHVLALPTFLRRQKGLIPQLPYLQHTSSRPDPLLHPQSLDGTRLQ
jgi:hypothetical protein